MPAQTDDFAKAIGMDLGESEVPSFNLSAWSDFQEIERARLQDEIQRRTIWARETEETLSDVRTRLGIWKLLAMTGWGLFSLPLICRSIDVLIAWVRHSL